MAVVLIILLSAFYAQVQHGDDLIKFKADSYVQFKFAGEYIKENSDPDDKIISTGEPQLTYYSERKVIYWPDEEDLDKFIEENKDVKFIILSSLEQSPPFTYAWPEKNKDKIEPVQLYFADEEQTRPLVVVYKVLDR